MTGGGFIYGMIPALVNMGYARECCIGSPIVTKVLKRVFDDLVMNFDEQELGTVSRFVGGLNIFEPVL